MTKLSYQTWSFKYNDGDTVIRVSPGAGYKPVWLITTDSSTCFVDANSYEYRGYETHFQEHHGDYETPKKEQDFYPCFAKHGGWSQANSCCPHCGAPDGSVRCDDETLKLDDDNLLKITRNYSCALCYEMWSQHLEAPVSTPTKNEVELP